MCPCLLLSSHRLLPPPPRAAAPLVRTLTSTWLSEIARIIQSLGPNPIPIPELKPDPNSPASAPARTLSVTLALSPLLMGMLTGRRAPTSLPVKLLLKAVLLADKDERADLMQVSSVLANNSLPSSSHAAPLRRGQMGRSFSLLDIASHDVDGPLLLRSNPPALRPMIVTLMLSPSLGPM